jgi:hypothetical protein
VLDSIYFLQTTELTTALRTHCLSQEPGRRCLLLLLFLLLSVASPLSAALEAHVKASGVAFSPTRGPFVNFGTASVEWSPVKVFLLSKCKKNWARVFFIAFSKKLCPVERRPVLAFSLARFLHILRTLHDGDMEESHWSSGYGRSVVSLTVSLLRHTRDTDSTGHKSSKTQLQ